MDTVLYPLLYIYILFFLFYSLISCLLSLLVAWREHPGARLSSFVFFQSNNSRGQPFWELAAAPSYCSTVRLNLRIPTILDNVHTTYSVAVLWINIYTSAYNLNITISSIHISGIYIKLEYVSFIIFLVVFFFHWDYGSTLVVFTANILSILILGIYEIYEYCWV